MIHLLIALLMSLGDLPQVDTPHPPIDNGWYSVWVETEGPNSIYFERWLVPQGTVFYQPATVEIIPATVDLRTRSLWIGEEILQSQSRE